MKSDVDSSDSKINECTNKALRLGMNLLEPADDNVQLGIEPTPTGR